MTHQIPSTSSGYGSASNPAPPFIPGVAGSRSARSAAAPARSVESPLGTAPRRSRPYHTDIGSNTAFARPAAVSIVRARLPSSRPRSAS